ncbi:glycosyltransferase [Gloeocapsopsis dulcis]|uniref:Glycosyl transferase family 1 n=1 Tax=Gloeocapsopsis dulcis AAB1 = 1H9 TaxID=1433147 RepID=A0A6N8FSH9_9CHRO|nr:glycosyltransferase [Gloeocapsopsis dulcis]MUL35704.1 glycosyl transferase family 1 [Gloeocapsopsis dulcis AAB1 = 1H9]WNN91013.1 glycosyltransferase [Gloeocapsopsis dulcis]
MKILFLDQSGKPGGAELCLLDIAKPYRDNCLVGLFADGSFKHLLQQHNIPVQVLVSQPIQVHKESSFIQSLSSISQIAPLIAQVVQLVRNYDVIYANTQKALVVGALASFLTHRPLVYHLHDILSAEHFSPTNRRLAVTLANRFASLVIANSKATQAAFIAAGGRADITDVVYNGFECNHYQQHQSHSERIRDQLGLAGQFVIGHFSRLSPWKGQHILIEALAQCPQNVTAIFVGDALFGEQDYVQQLHQQVTALNLEKRVKFLGFCSDVIPLMTACDLVAHTSTAPEPFGRVIVEAMLCGRPVIAAQAGGAMELVETGKTGWLIPPGEPTQLASIIVSCLNQPQKTATIARQGQLEANQRFDLKVIEQQLTQLLDQLQVK